MVRWNQMWIQSIYSFLVDFVASAWMTNTFLNGLLLSIALILQYINLEIDYRNIIKLNWKSYNRHYNCKLISLQSLYFTQCFKYIYRNVYYYLILITLDILFTLYYCFNYSATMSKPPCDLTTIMQNKYLCRQLSQVFRHLIWQYFVFINTAYNNFGAASYCCK